MLKQACTVGASQGAREAQGSAPTKEGVDTGPAAQQPHDEGLENGRPAQGGRAELASALAEDVGAALALLASARAKATRAGRFPSGAELAVSKEHAAAAATAQLPAMLVPAASCLHLYSFFSLCMSAGAIWHPLVTRTTVSRRSCTVALVTVIGARRTCRTDGYISILVVLISLWSFTCSMTGRERGTPLAGGAFLRSRTKSHLGDGSLNQRLFRSCSSSHSGYHACSGHWCGALFRVPHPKLLAWMCMQELMTYAVQLDAEVEAAVGALEQGRLDAERKASLARSPPALPVSSHLGVQTLTSTPCTSKTLVLNAGENYP